MLPLNLSRRFTVFTVLSLLIGVTSATVDFTNCLNRVKNSTDLTGALNNTGRPVSNISATTAVSYDRCITSCGTGAEGFSWTVFAEQFNSWLLPWLALLSQLPFGSRLRSDNFVSVILTVGSPMLAGYSLVLTVLNGQWVARKFRAFRYSNVREAARVLSNLQEAPLKIASDDGLLASLVVLPQNDVWWKDMADGLDYEYTWSAANATSIAWVVLAYLFTVGTSFADMKDTLSNLNDNGESVGSVFLWLLPIVVGWLKLSPKCDYERVVKAFDKVSHPFVASDSPRSPTAASKNALSIETVHHLNSVYSDNESSAPIFNYSRLFSWTDAVERVAEPFHFASANAEVHQAVDPNVAWYNGIEKGEDGEDRNRLGTLEQVVRYCSSLRNPPRQSSASESVAGSGAPLEEGKSRSGLRKRRWSGGLLVRVLIASLLGGFLQWGTILSGFLVLYATPARGLGCRSASFLLYAILSTISWALMITSSFLAHYSTFSDPNVYRQSYHLKVSRRSSNITANLSVLCRRAGKFVATISAVWIIVACVLQFAGLYDNCYCNGSVLSRGEAHAYIVLQLTSADFPAMWTAWLGALILGLGSAILCTIFVWLLVNPKFPQ